MEITPNDADETNSEDLDRALEGHNVNRLIGRYRSDAVADPPVHGDRRVLARSLES